MDIRLEKIQTSNGGRGSYARMQTFKNDYKRSSPEVRSASARLFPDPGPTQNTVDSKSGITKFCKEMLLSDKSNPSRPYSMASWTGEKMRVQLAQAMSGITYSDV